MTRRLEGLHLNIFEKKQSTVFNQKCLDIYRSYIYIYIYIYIYMNDIYLGSMYHTITDVYTTALFLTKPSSDDDSEFRHGFGAEASLPKKNQSAPAVSHHTTRLCQIVVAL